MSGGTPLDVIGLNDTVRKGYRKAWQRNQGQTISEIYTGPGDKIEELWTNKIGVASAAYYDSVTMERTNGRGQLIATWGGVGDNGGVLTADGDPLYELYANEVTRKVENAPYFIESDDPTAKLTAADIAIVFAIFRREATTPDGADTPLVSTLADKSLALYNMLQAGVTEYYESQYVLRETKITSERSTLEASKANVNTVQTPPDPSTENPLVGDLPAGEWLKKAPIVRTNGISRWSISQEWWWATKWSSVLYGGTLVYG